MSASSSRSGRGPDSTSVSGATTRRAIVSLVYRVARNEKDKASDVINKSVINLVSFIPIARYPRRVFW